MRLIHVVVRFILSSLSNRTHTAITLLTCLSLSLLWATSSPAATPPSAGTVMTPAEMAKQATQQSADKHRIEALPNGRARIPAPLQGIEATAAPEGLTVVSTTKGESGAFALRAQSLGRTGGAMAAIPRGTVTVEGQLARISHPGLTEELTTSADGVRQDFVVATAPAGKGDLALELTVTGALLDKNGDAARLTLESGRELLYHRLLVTDSTGKTLPAKFAITGPEQLRIVVADAGAVYPLRIDPTITDADWVSIALPDANGAIHSVVVAGTDLYAAGDFSAIDGIPAKHIAKWNGSAWSPLGNGMNDAGYVYALAWDGANLYAGGAFTSVGVMSANYIAKWNGSDWSALGSGMNNPVYALVWNGANLYAGGQFTTAGGVSANKIAKWNGSDWSALGSGLDNKVNALAWDGANLYAGGQFTFAGELNANRIAKWDGSAWSALGSGMDNEVSALAWDGANLYAGGWFTTADGVSANKIAKWIGSSWSSLGSGMSGPVTALAWDGANLYAGGAFSTAGGVSANRIAKWNGSDWSPLGSGMNTWIYVLVWDGANLYAGGAFTSAGGVSANRIAKWNGSAWSPLGSGMNGRVYAQAWYGTKLYVGGGFTTTGEVSANGIATWDGSAWSSLGTGMINGTVNALAWDGANLYAGGNFATAGGVSANYIAKWNGSAWSPLGTGIIGSVNALAWDGTNLYAGGNFTTAGGVSANYIAKWNGSAWSPLGTGMGGSYYSVSALVWDGANLYAGGQFPTAGGIGANHIAKWNGSSWSALGSGMNNPVYALALDGANLYAAGAFTSAGGVSANKIAKWNGSAWSPLGSGMNSNVNALAWDGARLYAGGAFTSAGGKSANVAYVKLNHAVTATAGANGSITSTNPLTVGNRDSASFTLTPTATYQPSNTVTGDCQAGSWNGNTYTTGAITADCTVGFTFISDTTPPDTSITSGPPASTSSTSFTFAFATNEAGATFECRLGSGAWGGCTSPYGNSIVYAQCTACRAVSQHSFAVRAKDPAGNTDPTPATWNWTINHPLTSPIGNVQDGGEVQLPATDITGDLTLSRAIAFTLKGGYASDYLSQTGVTTIHGAVTVAAGTVTMDNIAIAP